MRFCKLLDYPRSVRSCATVQRARDIFWLRKLLYFNTNSLSSASRDIMCRRDKREKVSLKNNSWPKDIASMYGSYSGFGKYEPFKSDFCPH